MGVSMMHDAVVVLESGLGGVRGYIPPSEKTRRMGHPAFGAGMEKRFAYAGANAHLSDDKTVAKMGHPIYWPRR